MDEALHDGRAELVHDVYHGFVIVLGAKYHSEFFKDFCSDFQLLMKIQEV